MENTYRAYGKIGMTTAPQGGPMVGEIRPESELESITSRIHRMATTMEEIGNKLCQHADALHGSPPPLPVGNEATPCRMGQLGGLHDALDRLERVHSFVAEQAGRNCTLA